jgi:hypothetical protein
MMTTFELRGNAPLPISVTNTVAERDKKKTEEGRLTSPPEVNCVTIDESPETQMDTCDEKTGLRHPNEVNDEIL